MLVVKLTKISYVIYFIFTIFTLLLHIVSFIKNVYVVFTENSVSTQIHFIGFQKHCTTNDPGATPTFCTRGEPDVPALIWFSDRIHISIILFVVATISIFMNLLCAAVKFQAEFNRSFCPMPTVTVKLPKNENSGSSLEKNSGDVDCEIPEKHEMLQPIMEKKNSNNMLWILTLTVWSLISFIFDVLGLHFIWPDLETYYQNPDSRPTGFISMMGDYLYIDTGFRLLLLATILTGVNAIMLAANLLFNITHVDQNPYQLKENGYQNYGDAQAFDEPSISYSASTSHYGKKYSTLQKVLPSVRYYEAPRSYQPSQLGINGDSQTNQAVNYYSKQPIHQLPIYAENPTSNYSIRKSKRKSKFTSCKRDSKQNKNVYNTPYETDFATYI